MADQFGGIPIGQSGTDQFGGVPVSGGRILPGESTLELNDAFWQAKSTGDEQGAAKAFKKLRGYGETISPAPDWYRAQGAQASAEGMGAGQQFAAGVGGRLISTGRGIGQLGMLAGMAQSPLGGVPMAQAYDQSKANESAQVGESAPLRATGYGFMGDITGAVAPYAAGGLGGLYLKSPELLAATLPNTARGAALQGGLAGLAQPNQTGDTEGTRLLRAGVGATIGGAITGAPRAIGYVANKVRSLSPAFTARMQQENAARILLEHSQDPLAVRQALQRNNVIVPGTRPSTAEATGDIGLAGLQRSLANTPEFGNELALLNTSNNAQRVRMVRSNFGNATSGSEAAQRQSVQDTQGAAINEAKRQTGAETGRVIASIDRVSKSPRFINAPPVQQALSTVRNLITVPLDDAARHSAARGVITDALATPFRKSAANHDALLEARRIVFGAQNRGEAAADTIKALRGIKADGRAQQIIGDMQRSLRVTERGKPDVASLYNARKYITGTLMKRADAETMTALRGVIANLDDQIGKVAPTYRQYLGDYAQGMRQADQMAVGEELLSASGAVRAADGNPILSPAKFSNAGEDLNQTVIRASGFPRATADRTLTAQQKATVDAVRRDLERLSRSQTDGKAIGSNTVQNAVGGNRLQSSMGPVGAAMIEPASGAALLALNGMRKKYGEQTFQVLQQAMLNPQEAASLLASLPPAQRSQAVQIVAQHFARIAGPTSANVAVSRK